MEAKVAHDIGMTPNILSSVGFVFALIAAVAYAITTATEPFWLIIAVIFLMFSGFCDTLDGILARTYKQASAFGGFLDSLLDRFSDAFVFGGIIVSGASTIFNPTLSLLAGLIALVSSFAVSYSRARAEAIGLKMESIGFAERPERIIILAVSSIVAFYWLPALIVGVLSIAALATITVFQRTIYVYQKLIKKEKDDKAV